MTMFANERHTQSVAAVRSALATTADRVAPAWLSIPACVLLVTAGACVRVPVPGTDVPMTLQSLAALLCGYWLRPRDAVAAMTAYLALGTAGLPVFQAGSLGLWGGTGGYLVGFVAAAWLVARLKGGPASGWGRLVAAGAAGTVAVLLCGVVWRIVYLGGRVDLALLTGLVPFVLKAAVQLGVAVSLVVSLRGLRRADRRREGAF